MPTEHLDPLLERVVEIDALEGAVAAASRGTGSVMVLEGPPGIGKSSLLDAAQECARAAGMRVLGARGAELERDFSYGLVRQLLEPLLVAAGEQERMRWLAGAARLGASVLGEAPIEAAEQGDRFARLHGLYWLCANLASDQPVLLAVDDAHWSDEPSLNFLDFLIRRLQDMPVSVVVATRSPEPSSPAALGVVLAAPGGRVLRLGSLSRTAVEAWVRRELGEEAEVGFARACHETTRGNPLLMRELLREVAAEQLRPTRRDAARVRVLGPRGVATTVLLRLRRLPASVGALARALAVLGDGAMLRDGAALAEVDEAEAADAAEALAGAEIIERRDGLRFVHPIVRASIYEELSFVEGGQLHARAARLRSARGAPIQEIAAHLLVPEPAGDPWVTEVLRDAARRALTMGDSSVAARYLRRALQEPPPGDQRPDVLAELGGAEALTGDLRAVEHLEQAVATLRDPRKRALAALALSNVLKFALEVDRAVEVLLPALEALGPEDADLAERMEVDLLAIRWAHTRPQPLIEERLASIVDPGGVPASFLESFHLAMLAWNAVWAMAPAERAADLARRALDGGHLPTDPVAGGQTFLVVMITLALADELGAADEALGLAIADAQARGQALGFATLSSLRAAVRQRSGALTEAGGDVVAALELAPELHGGQAFLPLAVGTGILSGLERGVDPARLRQMLDSPYVEHDSGSPPYSQYMLARAALSAAHGDLHQALHEYLACDRSDPMWAGGNPSLVPWRSGAALVHARLGDRAAAQRLAADEVDLARRFGAPRALGIALRTTGLVGERAERVDWLREAVRVLAGSPARLEHARALVDLGASIRVAGERRECQPHLERGHELARACGASELAARARDELVAAGARAPREAPTGIESLTAAERRVAELAASGLTNRDIAQTLFVTEKTVESHLGHVYDKLGVRSRRKLPAILGRAPTA